MEKRSMLVVRDGTEWNVAMSTALVRCYGRCGNPEKAVAVFENFSGNKDVGLWTAMILCVAQNQNITEAIQVFEQQGFRASNFPLVALLQGLSSSSKSGFDLVLWNAMVWAYADPEEALFVLKMMDLEGDKDDTFTFATVLTACATSCEHALLQTNFLHDRATSLGLGSDPVVVAAVINSYSKSQRLGLARSTFEGLATDKRDAVPLGLDRSSSVLFLQHGARSQLGGVPD
ncbi:hypothetical protein SELMODRAFT_424025 [Selaginella moellendorffii]|uniref:Pentacotripeptide-repeat region of PRORP domain-containing protein n=1 Tax=Selaginella moellendorffii TaxID=88036 RepID=D8SNJ9_SELML|nr:hypothetical protein SELMODRAFT_424025 [Selaginella moellendorffii]